MCGIVGVAGSGLPILLDGLSRLEYRGYDSAGVALRVGSSLWTRRRSGRLGALVDAVSDAPPRQQGWAHPVGHARSAERGQRPSPVEEHVSSGHGLTAAVSLTLRGVEGSVAVAVMSAGTRAWWWRGVVLR